MNITSLTNNTKPNNCPLIASTCFRPYGTVSDVTPIMLTLCHKYHVHSSLCADVDYTHGIRLITNSKELKLSNSLKQSNVYKNSRVVMVVVTHGGHLSEE